MARSARRPARPPVWLRVVMQCDKIGSAWYIGVGFLFAPVLVAINPWPVVRTVALVMIAVSGLWLGLLGVAMAAGLAGVLRRGEQLPDSFWGAIINDPTLTATDPTATARGERGRVPGERSSVPGDVSERSR